MNDVPAEIACLVAEKCDLPSLISLRQVNVKWFHVAAHLIQKVRSIDLQKDVYSSFLCKNDDSEEQQEQRVAQFLFFLWNKVTGVRSLRLNAPLIRLTCSHFILLARVLPYLESLEVEQDDEKQQISYDVFYSLCYFRSLRRLSINGWTLFHFGNNGCGHRPTLPVWHFLTLESLSLHNTPTILNFLTNLNNQDSIMTKLQEIELIFTMESSPAVDLINKFFEKHKEVRAVTLTALRYESTQDVQQFMRTMQNMKSLRQLQLNDVEFPTNLDPEIINTFIKEMNRRGVHLQVQ